MYNLFYKYKQQQLKHYISVTICTRVCIKLYVYKYDYLYVMYYMKTYMSINFSAKELWYAEEIYKK